MVGLMNKNILRAVGIIGGMIFYTSTIFAGCTADYSTFTCAQSVTCTSTQSTSVGCQFDSSTCPKIVGTCTPDGGGTAQAPSQNNEVPWLGNSNKFKFDGAFISGNTLQCTYVSEDCTDITNCTTLGFSSPNFSSAPQGSGNGWANGDTQCTNNQNASACKISFVSGYTCNWIGWLVPFL